jgi:ABC-2 type transport system permease protein
MTTTAVPATATHPLASVRPARVAYQRAFLALLARDGAMVRKNWRLFIMRTIMQPLLMMFVFTYVFPKIGQGIGGSGVQGSDAAAQFSTVLVAGVVGLAIIFQGVQSVALPLVTEFGYSKEIEDRVLAPLPVALVAIEKIVAGMIQGLLSAVIVFPIAAFVPATSPKLHFNWLILLTLAPLAGWTSGALGLALGTKVQPMQVPQLFAFIVLPMTMLGCLYFPWTRLSNIAWLKVLVLINPLVYMCEGFRAALTRSAHMPLVAVYGALVAFAGFLTFVGVRGFERRVVN